MEKVQYQFNEELGNGTAATAVMKGPVGSLTTATYSTCPPGQRQWEFSAGRISVDDRTATGVAHNVTLRLGGVPVLWLPVISFPTDDKRRSGLLSPTLGRDDINGLDVRLPVYLNLAPNYDATITPRWLSKRGLMTQGEFRYMTEHSQGQFNGTWLPNDDLTGEDRSLLNWKSNSKINRHWYTSANLNDVSDVNYFSDFGDNIDATSISLLSSTAGVYRSRKILVCHPDGGNLADRESAGDRGQRALPAPAPAAVLGAEAVCPLVRGRHELRSRALQPRIVRLR